MIVLAEADLELRQTLSSACKANGLRPYLCERADQLLANLDSQTKVVCISTRLEDLGWATCARLVRRRYPTIRIIVLCGNTQLASFSDGGYADMIYRIPAQIDELIDDLSSNSTAYLQGGNGTLVSHLEDKLDTWNIDHLIACPVLQLIENPVADDYVMLLQGEPGSGKQLIAQMAHEKSQFTEGLFLTLNAAELDSKSLEIELKSIERGQILMQLVQYSITRGNLASLTLYIDELARLTPEAQESVLALIRRGSSFPQGSSSLRQDINIPIRVILATRYGFASLEDEFEMNEDLLFQLRTQTLRIPPLRERVGDIPALAKAIVKYLALSQGLATIPRIRNDAMERLLMYSWPGNIRELRKVLCHAVMRSEDGEITRSRLQFSGEFGCIEPVDGPSLGGLPLRELERRAIEETLVLCRGNKAEAARHLGISERGIYNKIKQLGIVSELRDRSDS